MEAPLLSQVEHLLGYYYSVLKASMLPWSIVLRGIFNTRAFVVLIVLLVWCLTKFVWRLVNRFISSPLVDVNTWAHLVGGVELLQHTVPWSCHSWGSVWFIAEFPFLHRVPCYNVPTCPKTHPIVSVWVMQSTAGLISTILHASRFFPGNHAICMRAICPSFDPTQSIMGFWPLVWIFYWPCLWDKEIPFLSLILFIGWDQIGLVQ